MYLWQALEPAARNHAPMSWDLRSGVDLEVLWTCEPMAGKMWRSTFRGPPRFAVVRREILWCVEGRSASRAVTQNGVPTEALKA